MIASVLALQPAGAFGFKWRAVPTDGSRTGVTAPNTSNIDEALGTFDGRTYVAPNGARFRKNSATAKAARLMIDAQAEMAYVKEVVGYSPKGISRRNGMLGAWSVDCLMRCAETEFGEKVDLGLMNNGGIRIDMPQGDVLVDDLLSMFPFKNYLCLVRMTGEDVMTLFKSMASRMQAVGGVKVTLKDGKIQELLVGGEPVDPQKVYNLATIDFVLDGGDGFFAGNTLDVKRSQIMVFDAIIANVRALTAAGTLIEQEDDGRIVNID